MMLFGHKANRQSWPGGNNLGVHDSWLDGRGTSPRTSHCILVRALLQFSDNVADPGRTATFFASFAQRRQPLHTMQHPEQHTRSHGPLKIAGSYLAIATLWIIFSDRLVFSWVQDPEWGARMQTLKGWLFIIGTAWLIYFLLKREIATYSTTTEHLSKSRQELLDILDAMPVGIVLTDGRTVEYININFSDRFGYSLDEIPTDEQWFLLAYPDPVYRHELVSAWRAELNKARESSSWIPPFEVKVTCKDGHVRQAIVNTQLINNRMVIIFTDITERELLRNELIKMQKLESIGVLAGGIAHDFNNILTGIMGNLSYARLLVAQEHVASQALAAAEKATKRATGLTRQLLTFARGGEPVKKVIAVRHLIEEAMAFMLRGTSIRGELRVDEDVRAIEVDEGQIVQVLHNVIINAVQAMPNGGILRVEAGNVQLDDASLAALPAGDYVRIAITDQGCGIPQEIQESIFDPYFTTKEFGSGLGLASAYSIMARHGGQISVESANTKGTVCTLLLPATDKPFPMETSQTIDQQSTTRDRMQLIILVMDDEQTIRDLATTMLYYLGYAVHVCEDGESAIRLYEEARVKGAGYAAVLMDLTIPGGLGGLETSRRILALDKDACLVVSSGYCHDPVMADYQAHGFAGVLPKPYTMAELEQVMDSVLMARSLS